MTSWNGVTLTDQDIGIVIQARMGSTRLPGKVLKNIGNKTLLDHVIDALGNLNTRAKVVLATSALEKDDTIKGFCDERNLDVYRGSEEDVLERYFHCAKSYGFSHIVRLTADNPFTDTFELDRLISVHLSEGNDYTHSFGQLPLGVGSEVFTFDALERSFQEGHEPHHREHVNEYIQENPDLFKIGVLEIAEEKHSPELRLTVDTEDDYRRACQLVAGCNDVRQDTETLIRKCLAFV